MTFDLSAARERLATVDPLIRRAIEIEATPAAPLARVRGAKERREKQAHRRPDGAFTATQLSILDKLTSANGQFVSTDRLGSKNCVANQIMWLREKLGRRAIESRAGFGYRLTVAGFDKLARLSMQHEAA